MRAQRCLPTFQLKVDSSLLNLNLSLSYYRSLLPSLSLSLFFSLGFSSTLETPSKGVHPGDASLSSTPKLLLPRFFIAYQAFNRSASVHRDMLDARVDLPPRSVADFQKKFQVDSF